MNIKAGRRTIEISNPDKVLFPGLELTKADLATYYRKIAEWLLPHIRGRALTLERCPDGIEGGCFIQQEATAYFPDYVGRAILKRKDGTDLEHVTCDNVATLVYLANQGVITHHMWFSRVGTPDFPDRLVFDLDPPGNDFALVSHAAGLLKESLVKTGLVPFPMTTGSKGLHVVVPLDGKADFDTTRSFAKDVASLLTVRHPDILTMEQRLNKREGRLFLDVQRNAYGQTGVAPFTVRTREGAPVATPLDWKELVNSDMHSQSYTVTNIFHRLSRSGDPWRGMNRRARSLNGPRKKLDRLLADGSGPMLSPFNRIVTT
jgi:bifunctional non-homologous end joining protein LigD